ncbi:MAG: glycoside hydrolase family 95 protein [Lachnospiraceae bacterium]|nr:glycoside hydrolase family 95 protein [Lachnospiraceae bacterium]
MSRLFYNAPANGNWDKALPIGNGKLGAMIFGEAATEHYQLNEDSLWYGGEMDRVNPDARKNLERIRELIFKGKIPEAERLLKYAFTGTPQSERSYQTLGDMYLDLMDTVTEPVEYERELDLETAIHRVKVKDKKSGITYARETLAAKEENVIVIRLSADRPGSISAGAMISRQCFYNRAWHDTDTAYFSGNTGGSGVEFCAGIKMVAEGAGVEALGEHVITRQADAVTIFITAATTFREKEIEEAVKRCLCQASQYTYEEIKRRHIEEYQHYFHACRLKLEYDTEKETVPTDERLKAEKIDNGLINTYFDYGRYLLISCSRPGSLPANLQGIWNDSLNPPWGSKYTININTQMNYWPAESLGLSECQRPLFDLIKRMAEKGKRTAEEMYGCRGFVAHHNTDIWADTAPQDMYIPATYWVMGGAWLCTHIWEHYEYTKNKSFLREMYPVLRDAVLFFVDFLVEHQGYYVTCPSVSPENTYILPDGTRGCNSFGVTMDNEILRDLFCQFLQAAELLQEKDTDFLSEVRDRLEQLPPMRIGSKGQLLEWIEEYGEAEPGHRHISHLYGLYPSTQIMVDKTPELAKAARVTLALRLENGGGHTGWSRAWMINLYARLWEEENAYQNLIALLKKSTLPNLLDTHPPFQIDGNFGATAAIGEMLLQSNGGRTVILPALPKAWDKGEIRGIRGRGGVQYDFSWEKGKVTELTATALCEVEKLKLIINERETELSLKQGESYHYEKKLRY